MRALLALILMCSAVFAQAAVQTREIRYQDEDGTALIGYYAYDDAVKGKRPGVLVVHEWWGLNDYAKRRARDLAALGYSALAIDMYGEGKHTEHPQDAQAFMAEAMKDPSASAKRFDAGLDLLKKQPYTDKHKLGAVGYCFGGKVVLDAARRGARLDGVVSFHGALATQTPVTQPGVVRAYVLVEHGEADSMVTRSRWMPSRRKWMRRRSTTSSSASGAKHGFTNPDADRLSHGDHGGPDIGYNEAADKRSWADMQAFFKQVFK